MDSQSVCRFNRRRQQMGVPQTGEGGRVVASILPVTLMTARFWGRRNRSFDGLQEIR